MSHFNFWTLAFSTNFCLIKTDLSGNTVWQQASGFQKLAKMDQFCHFSLTFVHSKCKRSSLRSQCWMRLFLWFSNTVIWVYLQIVVVGCAMLYALPNMKISLYRQVIFPLILPWLLPVIQIAMMSSVYCTTVMSFERYIRICHLCQLRDCSYITTANFKWVAHTMSNIPKSCHL